MKNDLNCFTSLIALRTNKPELCIYFRRIGTQNFNKQTNIHILTDIIFINFIIFLSN